MITSILSVTLIKMFCYYHTGTRVFSGALFPKENFMTSIRCPKKCPLLISFHFNFTILQKNVKKNIQQRGAFNRSKLATTCFEFKETSQQK